MRYSLVFVLAVSALVLAGCGGSTSSSGTTGPTTTTESAATTPPTTTTTGTTTAVNEPVTIRVVVTGGKPVGGIQRATVKKGQRVAIVVHAHCFVVRSTKIWVSPTDRQFTRAARPSILAN